MEAGDGRFEVAPGDGGLQLAAWFRDGEVDDEALARRLHTQGIGAMALSRFYLASPCPGLLFGIGAATGERVAHLAEAVRAEFHRHPSAPTARETST